MSRKLDVVHLSGEEYDDLLAERDALRDALIRMLTYYNIDEDKWSAPIHAIARAALTGNKG